MTVVQALLEIAHELRVTKTYISELVQLLKNQERRHEREER